MLRIGYLCRALAYCHLVPPQAFTGAVPFNDSVPAAAMLAVMSGKRPPRPTHPNFTDELWELTQRCWDQDPRSRPEVSELLGVLRDSSVFLSFQRSHIRWPDCFSWLVVHQPGNA